MTIKADFSTHATTLETYKQVLAGKLTLTDAEMAKMYELLQGKGPDVIGLDVVVVTAKATPKKTDIYTAEKDGNGDYLVGKQTWTDKDKNQVERTFIDPKNRETGGTLDLYKDVNGKEWAVYTAYKDGKPLRPAIFNKGADGNYTVDARSNSDLLYRNGLSYGTDDISAYEDGTKFNSDPKLLTKAIETLTQKYVHDINDIQNDGTINKIAFVTENAKITNYPNGNKVIRINKTAEKDGFQTAGMLIYVDKEGNIDWRNSSGPFTTKGGGGYAREVELKDKNGNTVWVTEDKFEQFVNDILNQEIKETQVFVNNGTGTYMADYSSSNSNSFGLERSETAQKDIANTVYDQQYMLSQFNKSWNEFADDNPDYKKKS